MTSTYLKEMIRKPSSRVFRKAYIKRRDATTGLFESTWQDISKDVKKWGSLKTSLDAAKTNLIKFDNFRLAMSNDLGRYNTESDESSLWYGYANQQRTLVKIRCGYLDQTKTAGNIWITAEVPDDSLWDAATFDGDYFDDESVIYRGIVSGDMFISDKNELTLNIKPLTQIFIDYPARNLVGYTSTGLTASEFVSLLRDHTDGAGSFIFRPFFEDTTSNWNINTTSNRYVALDSANAQDVIDSSCWEIIEKLCEAENYVAYIGLNGVFNFVPKTQSTSTTYVFYGLGYENNEYGNTVVKVNKYGRKISDYYSRIQVKWVDDDTATSYIIKESTLTVSGVNAAWNYGIKTLEIDNYWLDSSTANTIANSLYSDLSTVRNELDFDTVFIPHLSLLDRIYVNYDSTEPHPESNWDANDWDSELIWDYSSGDALRLINKEFKVMSISLDLDGLKTNFVARET